MKKIENLSFCISSRGERDIYLKRLIYSIHLQEIDIPYEIIVGGWTNLSEKEFNFRLIEDKNNVFNCLMGEDKNVITNQSKYDVLVFLDDDSELLAYWWYNVKKLDLDEFDLTPFKLYELKKDGNVREWYDWAEILTGRSVLKDWNEPANERTYIGGGSLIVKKDVMLKVKANDGRGWDGRFSFDCYRQGFRLKAFYHMRNAVCVHYLAKEGRH